MEHGLIICTKEDSAALHRRPKQKAVFLFPMLQYRTQIINIFFVLFQSLWNFRLALPSRGQNLRRLEQGQARLASQLPERGRRRAFRRKWRHLGGRQLNQQQLRGRRAEPLSLLGPLQDPSEDWSAQGWRSGHSPDNEGEFWTLMLIALGNFKPAKYAYLSLCSFSTWD